MGRNIDPSILAQGKHIFSVHPPFNLIILYGLQNLSVNPGTYAGDRYEIWEKYAQDTPLAFDINERLVESDPEDQATRIVLEAVEFSDMSTGYGPDGSVVTETYSFFARDVIIPTHGSGMSQNNMPGLVGPKSIT